MSAKSKARKRKRDEAALRGAERALSIECPVCGVRPGVWCGPVYHHARATFPEPWMHGRRYVPSE